MKESPIFVLSNSEEDNHFNNFSFSPSSNSIPLSSTKSDQIYHGKYKVRIINTHMLYVTSFTNTRYSYLNLRRIGIRML